MTGKNTGYVAIGALAVGEKPSGWADNMEAFGTLEIASLGLVTECVNECIAGRPMVGMDVLYRVEFPPRRSR